MKTKARKMEKGNIKICQAYKMERILIVLHNIKRSPLQGRLFTQRSYMVQRAAKGAHRENSPTELDTKQNRMKPGMKRLHTAPNNHLKLVNQKNVCKQMGD